MIEYRNGFFGEVEPATQELLSRFVEEASVGQAVAMHIGTHGELSEVQHRRRIEERISTLEDKIKAMSPVKTELYIPTTQGIERFTPKTSREGERGPILITTCAISAKMPNVSMMPTCLTATMIRTRG